MKLKPVQIELRFQELKNQFDEARSIRFRYRLFTDFVKGLEGKYSVYESYITELLLDLPEFSSPVTWSGIPPYELEEMVDIFSSIRDSLEDLVMKKHLDGLLRRLRQVTVLIYSCLNELEAVDRHLQKLLKAKPGFLEFVVSASDQNQPGIELLHSFINHHLEAEYSHPRTEFSVLKSLKSDCTEILNQKDSSVYVPVVEHYLLPGQEEIFFGRVRTLTVKAIGEQKTHDELTWDFHVLGAEQPKGNRYSEQTEAARRLISKENSITKYIFYKGAISYEMTGASHDGSSANLAVSALWYTEIQSMAGIRERYRINSSTAITGDVDSKGNIKPVEPDSIDLKVQGAFFSWCSCLVVPYDQLRKFEKKRNQLHNKYPDRNLELIPVKHLKDLFYDRRVAIFEQTGRIAHTAKKIWRQRYSIASISTIIVLAVIIFGLVHGPIDKNPTSYYFQGQYLILTNSNGSELKRIPIDRETVEYQNSGNYHIYQPLVAFYDITGDDINDVVWASRGDFRSANTSEIQAYSVSGDSIIWQTEFKMEYTFPRQSAHLQTGLRTNEIGIIELDNYEVRVITLNESGIYFTSAVHSLDIFTGDIVSDYLHIGALFDMFLIDLTDNGTEEIILSGVNNAYWNAAVVVLDPLNLQGHSPLTPDYKPDGVDQADEVHYILIPKTVIADYVTPVEKYNFARLILYDEVSNRVRIMVQESRRVFRDTDLTADILLYFDRSMRPAGVGTNDIYDIIARELYEEGSISTLPDYDYFESFQDSILYWDGEEFVKKGEFFN